LRKVLGATRRQLIAQFLGESVPRGGARNGGRACDRRSCAAGVQHVLDADISSTISATGVWLLPLLGLVLVVGVLAGLYPATYLARFKLPKS
jgi:putative ABC transport system permease protein